MLADGFERAKKFTATEEMQRPPLEYVYFKRVGDLFEVVASDGFKAISLECFVEIDTPDFFYIHRDEDIANIDFNNRPQVDLTESAYKKIVEVTSKIGKGETQFILSREMLLALAEVGENVHLRCLDSKNAVEGWNFCKDRKIIVMGTVIE